MNATLINSVKEFGKLVGVTAFVFTGVYTGIHIASKVAPMVTTGVDAVTGAVAGVVVGARSRAGALLKRADAPAPAAEAHPAAA